MEFRRRIDENMSIGLCPQTQRHNNTMINTPKRYFHIKNIFENSNVFPIFAANRFTRVTEIK